MTITREDIFRVADEIKASGETPTLAAIRKRLGGGSFTTISETVKEWRAKGAPKAPIQASAPDTIKIRLDELGSDIWTAAITMANNRLDSERIAIETTKAELETARSEAAELADQLAAELDAERERASQAATVASESLKALGQRFDAALQGELQGQSQVRELTAKLDEMAVRVDDAKAVASKEAKACAEEASKHDATRQRLSSTDADLAACKAELGNANKQAATLLAESAALRQRLSELESALAVSTAGHAHASEQARERAVEMGRLHKQFDDLSDALKKALSVATATKVDLIKTDVLPTK